MAVEQFAWTSFSMPNFPKKLLLRILLTPHLELLATAVALKLWSGKLRDNWVAYFQFLFCPDNLFPCFVFRFLGRSVCFRKAPERSGIGRIHES